MREKLLDTLRAPQIVDIHQRLSEAVQRNLGRIHDFPTFIPDLVFKDGPSLDKWSLPFAEVNVPVLRRLGGYYAERAEQLTSAIVAARQKLAADHEKLVKQRLENFAADHEKLVKKMAYWIWDNRGRQTQKPLDFWLAAENFVQRLAKGFAQTNADRRLQEMNEREFVQIFREYMHTVEELAENMWKRSSQPTSGNTLDFWVAAEKHVLALTIGALVSASTREDWKEVLVAALKTFSAPTYLELIRRRAYYLWKEAGGRHLEGRDFYLQAEMEALKELAERRIPYSSDR